VRSARRKRKHNAGHDVKIIVGLGNPGREYERTPHNIGFRVVDELARRWACPLRRRWRFRAETASALVRDEDVLLVKPGSFMNNSGGPVGDVLRYRRANADALVVVLDDADLELGRIRIRPGGSSGGHRGLASIIERIGTDAFTRVRLGIGRRRGERLVQHVLKRFSAEDEEQAEAMASRAADAVEYIMSEGVAAAMNAFNAAAPDDGTAARSDRA
jgi:PTH1 family peptidyl-tRNA hydrolase